MKKLVLVLFLALTAFAFMPQKPKVRFVVKERAMDFYMQRNERYAAAMATFKTQQDSLNTFKKNFGYQYDCRRNANLSPEQKAAEQELYDSVKMVLKKFHEDNEKLLVTLRDIYAQLKPAMEDSVKNSFDRFCLGKKFVVRLVDAGDMGDLQDKLNLTREYLRFVGENK